MRDRWIWMAAAGWLHASVAGADPAPTEYFSYDGTAMDTDGGKVLYRESHYLAQQGPRVLERLVLYRCADGAPFARKRVTDSGRSPWLPAFDMRDARLKYREGARADAQRVEVFVQEPGESALEQEVLDEVPGDLVGDAGFDRFVQDHWKPLLDGETVHFNFLVPSRLDYLAFKVRHLGRQEVDGRAAEVFRLALGGLLGLVVSGIDVAYDTRSRVLLRFEGLSNVRDPQGDNYVARIDFPPDARRTEADAAAMEAARAVPLVSECALAAGD